MMTWMRLGLPGAFLVGTFLIAAPVQAEEVSFAHAFSPRGGATALVVKTIGEAEKSICLASYSFTSQPVADALIKAHNAGVDVKVVMDKSQRKQQHSLLSYVVRHGLPVRINAAYAIMHNKFMVIDHETLQLGSFNYTSSAEKRNAENVLVIKGKPSVVDAYATECQRLWEEANDR